MKVYLRENVQAARYRASTTFLSGTDLLKHLRKFTSITAGRKIKTTPWSMWYYLWTGAPALESDDRATYNFLIAGHAKFVPDWCFGLVKQRTRKTSISSLFDIARAVDRGFGERLRFTFTPNGKREFAPRDQVFPLFFVYRLLLLHKNM